MHNKGIGKIPVTSTTSIQSASSEAGIATLATSAGASKAKLRKFLMAKWWEPPEATQQDGNKTETAGAGYVTERRISKELKDGRTRQF